MCNLQIIKKCVYYAQVIDMLNRMEQIMREKNISQKALAVSIRRAPSTISGYASGIRQPDWQTTIEIANALGTSVDYLIGATDTPPDEAEAEMLKNLHYQSAQLGQEEQEILKRAGCLNMDGVERLIEYAELLHKSDKYRKESGTTPPG